MSVRSLAKKKTNKKKFVVSFMYNKSKALS